MSERRGRLIRPFEGLSVFLSALLHSPLIIVVHTIPGRISSWNEFTPVPSCGAEFVNMITPENVIPARVHPGFCTGARISFRYEISQRYHVNEKRTGLKLSPV